MSPLVIVLAWMVFVAYIYAAAYLNHRLRWEESWISFPTFLLSFIVGIAMFFFSLFSTVFCFLGKQP